MSEYMISVKNLGKRYSLGETLHDDLLSARIVQGLRRALRGVSTARTEQSTEFWAVKDVSFEVRAGEVLGVIGRNGAGKSTLLKILSRITEPTRGEVRMKGRVASLLEVGTGFHKELSGRENVFLNGAILGMSRAEIKRKFDEIVDFSGVEKFIDTPVKRYSSGMTVRLAFAVAANLEPEILLIDEVLAVGDAEFQKRCISKMRDVSGEGRTLLFVSHNLNAVQSLCTRCIWLDQGQTRLDGATRDVLHEYRREGHAVPGERQWTDIDKAPGNNLFKIKSIAVRPVGGTNPADITIDSGIDIIIEYWNLDDGARLNLSLVLANEDEAIVLNAIPLTDFEWFGKPHPAGLYRAVVQIPPRLINSGTHSIELLAVHDQTRVVFKLEDALMFEVSDMPEPGVSWFGRFPGAVRPRLPWNTEFLGTQ